MFTNVYLQLFKYFSFAPYTFFDGVTFLKQFWIIEKWSYSTVKQTNEAQYAYGYICLLLEKHMVMRVRTFSWKYKASFKYFMLFLETNQ